MGASCYARGQTWAVVHVCFAFALACCVLVRSMDDVTYSSYSFNHDAWLATLSHACVKRTMSHSAPVPTVQWSPVAWMMRWSSRWLSPCQLRGQRSSYSFNHDAWVVTLAYACTKRTERHTAVSSAQRVIGLRQAYSDLPQLFSLSLPPLFCL